MTKRIAMWSGPRNISTAMMRSWENRNDCSVVDEPFYAYYLKQTKSPHPMFEEVVASQPIDYSDVAESLTHRACETKLQYQKHMTHHMLKNGNLQWTESLIHCFLIREPAYVIHSYTQSRGECSSEDIGIVRQFELYKEISDLTGQVIPVIDSAAVLADPKSVLTTLCTRLGISFDEAMLNWPAGKRVSDGVWASHWYHSVEKSTQFCKPEHKVLSLNRKQQKLADELEPYYQHLKAFAITPHSAQD